MGININCMMYLMQYRTSKRHIPGIGNRIHGQQEGVASLGLEAVVVSDPLIHISSVTFCHISNG